MSHTVKTQSGTYLDGKEREEIIFTTERDMTHTYINGEKVEILSHFVDEDGNKETVVRVEYESRSE